jgi:hypothetical protein
LRALQCADSGLPAGYRSILAQITATLRAEDIRVDGCHARQVRVWLDELDTLSFVRYEEVLCAEPLRVRPTRAQLARVAF